MNRFVRQYNASAAKHCDCHDAFLEHGNILSSEFPMPRSLVCFAKQNLYAGCGLMCYAFENVCYTNKFDNLKVANYSRFVLPNMTP
jgi:hypothetical protein